MLKKTSTIIALAIATILTAYILALTLSNQVFAQSASNSSHVGHPVTAPNSGKTFAGDKPQQGNVNTPTNPAIENEIKMAKDRLAPKKVTISAMKAGSNEVMYENKSIVTEQINRSSNK